jgi:hypothetical protein
MARAPSAALEDPDVRYLTSACVRRRGHVASDETLAQALAMRQSSWLFLVSGLIGCGGSGAPAGQAGLAGATPTSAASAAIAVPKGAAPSVDGVVAPDEWAAAHRIEIGAGASLHLMHDDKNLYLAVSGVPAHGFGLACVFIAEGELVHVLHASAKIGSAVYAPAGDGLDPRAKEYAWKEPDALMREEHWLASVVDTRDGSSQEFAIAFERLALAPGAASSPIALGYLYLDSATDKDDQRMSGLLTWPAGTGDAVANKELLGGWNPAQLRFTRERWARLRLADAAK